MNKRLLEERTKLGLNQTEMAKLAEVGMRTYCDYETGKTEPKASFFIALKKSGIVDVDYILFATRSQETATEPPANYAVLNKKRMDNLMDDLDPQQQGDLIKHGELIRRLNQCELALEELKKSTG